MIKPSRVFIYGSLKRGHHNHGLIEGCFEFIGEAITRHPYPLVVNYGLPYMLPFVGCGYPVKGELIEVEDENMAELDDLEGVPHHYVRRSIPVICNDMQTMAWCYLCSPAALNLKHAKYVREY